jgi:hypothetical protein
VTAETGRHVLTTGERLRGSVPGGRKGGRARAAGPRGTGGRFAKVGKVTPPSPLSALIVLPDIPTVDQSSQLAKLGSETGVLETNVARMPAARPLTSVPLVSTWQPTGRVYGSEVSVLGSVTTRDLLLLAEICRRYVAAGCPRDRVVRITLAEAARVILGKAAAIGGRNRRDVKDSLGRLRSLTLTSVVRLPNGRKASFPLIWGWLAAAGPSGDMGLVRLEEELADLLRIGSVTWVHQPTWRALILRDEYAGRLWAFLEAETRGWTYDLFPDPEHDGPSISEVLRLDWKWGRKAVAKSEWHTSRRSPQVRSAEFRGVPRNDHQVEEGPPGPEGRVLRVR